MYDDRAENRDLVIWNLFDLIPKGQITYVAVHFLFGSLDHSIFSKSSVKIGSFPKTLQSTGNIEYDDKLIQ